MRVLIVDDESGIRTLVGRLLEADFEVEILEAADGLAALDTLLTDRIDLVMLDLSMRVMSGIETLEAIRRSPSYGHLPVIVMTGRADEDRVNRAVELGISGLVVKPFNRDSLRDRVSKILRLRSGAGMAPVSAGAPIEIQAGQNVLVIDENAEFRSVAAAALGRLGTVEQSDNEFAALARCREVSFATVVIGTTSEFSSPESVARKIRTMPLMRDVRLVAAVAPGVMDAAGSSGVYDAVILRSFVGVTFTESLMRTLGPASLARLLLHPQSVYIPELFGRIRLDLGRALKEPVTILEQPPLALQPSRWVFADTEILVAKLAWDVRLRVPLRVALQLESARSGTGEDRISEDEMTRAAGLAAAMLAEGITSSLTGRGLPASALVPRTVLTSPLDANPGTTDPAGSRQWFLSGEGQAVSVELVYLGGRP